MIGNDMIDLALAQKESNWQRKGFLKKIFTPNEQLMILNAAIPEIMVWNLWSRKEAAYKIYNRQTKIRAFIPTQLECIDLEMINDFYYGKVLCHHHVYYTRTSITHDCITTVAVMNSADFDKILTLPCGVKIIKCNGIPNYYNALGELKPVTKSHHGSFEQCLILSD